MSLNLTVLYTHLPNLLHGAVITLKIAFLSCCMGLSLGTFLGFALTGQSKILRIIANAYVTIIRGTPLLIQIMFIYAVLPVIGIHIPEFWVATLAIGLNSGAYISQVISSGIASVNKGQIEAGRVLGFTRFQIMRYIVLPQALSVVIPALGNEFISLVKESSLASVIGVMELTKEGQLIKSQTFDIVTPYLGMALIYLTITSSLSLFIKRLERRMKRSC